MEIEDFYGDSVARRSGVLMMNHITEGVKLLKHLGASPSTIRAFKLHPIFQDDHNLAANYKKLLKEPPEIIALVLEYRNIANSSLSDIVYRDYSKDWLPLALKREIKTSPIEAVNQMLIADKSQNYKDFMLYHYGSHARSDELEFYFTQWHIALGIRSEVPKFIEVMSGVS